MSSAQTQFGGIESRKGEIDMANISEAHHGRSIAATFGLKLEDKLDHHPQQVFTSLLENDEMVSFSCSLLREQCKVVLPLMTLWGKIRLLLWSWVLLKAGHGWIQIWGSLSKRD